MVRERNQFFTRKIAGVPVVVQRTESGIRAFLNQCPHRLSAIQTECTGQRPLVCPYHAWSFGAEGSWAFRTPACTSSAPRRARIGLRKLHLEEVGQLLFVNLADDPLPLREQFDDDSWKPWGGLLAPGYAADLQLPQGALQLKLNMENERPQPRSLSSIQDLPPGDDRSGARFGTRGCGAVEVLRLLQEGETPELRSLSFPTRRRSSPTRAGSPTSARATATSTPTTTGSSTRT